MEDAVLRHRMKEKKGGVFEEYHFSDNEVLEIIYSKVYPDCCLTSHPAPSQDLTDDQLAFVIKCERNEAAAQARNQTLDEVMKVILLSQCAGNCYCKDKLNSLRTEAHK